MYKKGVLKIISAWLMFALTIKRIIANRFKSH